MVGSALLRELVDMLAARQEAVLHGGRSEALRRTHVHLTRTRVLLRLAADQHGISPGMYETPPQSRLLRVPAPRHHPRGRRVSSVYSRARYSPSSQDGHRRRTNRPSCRCPHNRHGCPCRCRPGRDSLRSAYRRCRRRRPTRVASSTAIAARPRVASSTAPIAVSSFLVRGPPFGREARPWRHSST